MASPGDEKPTGAVILTGGLSRRMGQPKALLPLGKHSFLEGIVASYRSAQITSLLAVTHGALKNDPRFPPLDGVDFIVLEQPTESPLQTLWHALDRIEGHLAAFFVHPVDHPFVRPATLAEMARVYAEEKPMIVQPRCGKSGGHPVLIDASLIPEIRKASPDQGLREVVRADPGRVRRLAVKDEGVLKGINTPDDLADLGDPLKQGPD